MQTSGSKLEPDWLVFFGSGPVAAKALELLHKHQSLEAVITKPQPLHHKESFPVLEVAKKLGLKTITVSDKAELSAVFASSILKSRAGVVIDFGIIIPQAVIDYFPLGIINSHFSLLPKWRGADPITHAILHGENETGVSLMLIVEKLDEGPLLAQEKLPISPGMTTPQLTEQLILLSDSLLKETLAPYLNSQLVAWPQDPSITPTYSTKLTKADGLIDWTKPAERLEREVRAYQGWPSSYTTLLGKEVKILAAKAVKYQAQNPGLVCNVDGALHVECGQDSLKIDKLQVAGKQPVTGAEFLRAYATDSQ